jgi:hypothetical protein
VRRFLLAEVGRSVIRLAVAFGLFGLISRVPWPAETAQMVGVVSFGLFAASIIVVFGKLLYDTLFYDHYWRKFDSK